jgi:hypothetical protein
MTNKANHICCLILFSSVFSFCNNQIFGQEKINISLGIGFPEAINIGLRHQLNQTQFGVSVGSFPAEDESIFSISGDVFYHFGGFSGFSTRRPWYIRTGLNYFRDEKISLFEYSYLNLRVGRDFNISKKIGIEFDWGIGLRLMDTSGWDIPVMPSFGLGLFCRL